MRLPIDPTPHPAPLDLPTKDESYALALLPPPREIYKEGEGGTEKDGPPPREEASLC